MIIDISAQEITDFLQCYFPQVPKFSLDFNGGKVIIKPTIMLPVNVEVELLPDINGNGVVINITKATVAGISGFGLVRNKIENFLVNMKLPACKFTKMINGNVIFQVKAIKFNLIKLEKGYVNIDVCS